MNNRYLFKAKRVDNGEWICGSLITGVFHREKDGVDTPYILNVDKSNATCFEDFTEGSEYFEVVPQTVCQCTGLRDDNGNMIFENDILSLEDSVNEIKWKAVVKYGNPNCENTYGWQLVELTECEVNKDILLWIETEMEYMKCKVITNKFD